ncbi:carboxylesterase family protein [Streptomyces sp. NPDC007076]|uniref:carboxylesterase/lipase family protein n=1 Tax=unclassified Streptomyces TaxID=2593676 RepID=UPI002E76D0FC|nr:carboxylesterase family protein [Streptomyces sp. JV190]MEE1840853.1 carboxylesterase family protein [Streptomyces sp. JV190]
MVNAHENTTEPALVKTASGVVAGKAQGGVVSFKGIPYAADPYRENRFGPPRPPRPWSGVLEAFEFGPCAPQPTTYSLADATPLYPWDTDCLSLNVYTPDPGSNRLPVMVWIHAGGYNTGSAATSRADGSVFAAEGVVVVAMNYRLGADGFLALPGGTVNSGMHDVVAALRWVRENIAAFGGDPDAVTVFGNSSGSAIIAAIARTVAAEGLIRRAILQSPCPSLVVEADEGRAVAAHVLADLGIDGDPRDVPLKELLGRRQRRLDVRFRDAGQWNPYTYWFSPFMPVVDDTLFTDSALSERIPPSVDLLIGTNRDESRYFLIRNGQFSSATEQDLLDAQNAYGVPEECRSAARSLYGHLPLGEQLAETVTNWIWRGPAIELTQLHARSGGNTFAYEFAWRESPAFDGCYGAAHFLEVPFLFDQLDDPAFAPQVGPDAPAGLGRTLRERWTRFAATGDPGWARYDDENRSVMVLDRACRIDSDPREIHRAAWDAQCAVPTPGR